MTSSQPVITKNAINFTPDNKRCYAYSGAPVLSESYVDWLNFNTNSEYIVCKILTNADWAGIAGNTLYINIYFNDELMIYERDTGSSYESGAPLFRLIVPPFTNFKLQMKAAAATYASASLTGDVYGMTETGYQ